MTWIDAAGITVGSALAAIIAAVMRRRRQAAAETEATPTVFAAIRELGTNPWRGRWRHGYVTVGPGDLRWRPRWPRPGPPVGLHGAELRGRPRRSESHENWWLAPGVRIYRVAAANTAGVEHEVAILPGSSRLFEDAIVPRPDQRQVGRRSRGV